MAKQRRWKYKQKLDLFQFSWMNREQFANFCLETGEKQSDRRRLAVSREFFEENYFDPIEWQQVIKLK